MAGVDVIAIKQFGEHVWLGPDVDSMTIHTHYPSPNGTSLHDSLNTDYSTGTGKKFIAQYISIGQTDWDRAVYMYVGSSANSVSGGKITFTLQLTDMDLDPYGGDSPGLLKTWIEVPAGSYLNAYSSSTSGSQPFCLVHGVESDTATDPTKIQTGGIIYASPDRDSIEGLHTASMSTSGTTMHDQANTDYQSPSGKATLIHNVCMGTSSWTKISRIYEDSRRDSISDGIIKISLSGLTNQRLAQDDLNFRCYGKISSNKYPNAYVDSTASTDPLATAIAVVDDETPIAINWIGDIFLYPASGPPIPLNSNNPSSLTGITLHDDDNTDYQVGAGKVYHGRILQMCGTTGFDKNYTLYQSDAANASSNPVNKWGPVTQIDGRACAHANHFIVDFEVQSQKYMNHVISSRGLNNVPMYVMGFEE